jgi:outer membrane lipoprotein LolB
MCVARTALRAAAVILALLLTACASMRRAPAPAGTVVPGPASSWDARLATLQQAQSWDLAGRVAVAVGTQGWQASLDWRQRGADSEVHLAGPLGIGASVLRLTAAGLSVDGAPPGVSALGQLQARLGFALPLAELRYWVLGVPEPGPPFSLERDAEDRALHLTQVDWNIDYDRYAAVDGDWLPARLALTRDDVRVRLVVEHWRLAP